MDDRGSVWSGILQVSPLLARFNSSLFDFLSNDTGGGLSASLSSCSHCGTLSPSEVHYGRSQASGWQRLESHHHFSMQ